MKEFEYSEAEASKAETAILVGLVTPTQDEAKTTEYLDELEFLADTAGAVAHPGIDIPIVSVRHAIVFAV